MFVKRLGIVAKITFGLEANHLHKSKTDIFDLLRDYILGVFLLNPRKLRLVKKVLNLENEN